MVHSNFNKRIPTRQATTLEERALIMNGFLVKSVGFCGGGGVVQLTSDHWLVWSWFMPKIASTFFLFFFSYNLIPSLNIIERSYFRKSSFKSYILRNDTSPIKEEKGPMTICSHNLQWPCVCISFHFFFYETVKLE